jgi:hypothetical protein
MARRIKGIAGGAGLAPALLLVLFALFLAALAPERAAASSARDAVAAGGADGCVAFLSDDDDAPRDRLLPIDPEDEAHVRAHFGAHEHLAFPLVAIVRAGFHASGGSVFAARAPPIPV